MRMELYSFVTYRRQLTAAPTPVLPATSKDVPTPPPPQSRFLVSEEKEARVGMSNVRE